MASRAALLIVTAAAMAAVVVGALRPATESSFYRVGGAGAWDVNVDYAAWTSGKTFRVNDTLEFAYSNAIHNVVLVGKRDYTACTVPSAAPKLTTGDDYVTLHHAGEWFFICGVEAHCKSGMKLALNVI